MDSSSERFSPSFSRGDPLNQREKVIYNKYYVRYGQKSKWSDAALNTYNEEVAKLGLKGGERSEEKRTETSTRTDADVENVAGLIEMGWKDIVLRLAIQFKCSQVAKLKGISREQLETFRTIMDDLYRQITDEKSGMHEAAVRIASNLREQVPEVWIILLKVVESVGIEVIIYGKNMNAAIDASMATWETYLRENPVKVLPEKPKIVVTELVQPVAPPDQVMPPKVSA